MASDSPRDALIPEAACTTTDRKFVYSTGDVFIPDIVISPVVEDIEKNNNQKVSFHKKEPETHLEDYESPVFTSRGQLGMKMAPHLDPNSLVQSPSDELPSEAKALKPIGLKNYATKTTVYDTLHYKAEQKMPCNSSVCKGPLMDMYQESPQLPQVRDTIMKKARAFIKQYYNAVKRNDAREFVRRISDISISISISGTYDLTLEEMIFATKLAWRNAPRCSGRSFWSNLRVIDGRNISSVREMFNLLCQHLRYATNYGNIRSTLTIFDQQRDDLVAFRMWNKQLLSYAGYRQPDGSVIGDPANSEFTEVCRSLGWKGRNGRFDILPWVLQKAEEDPEVYEIPSDLVLEVKITHPRFPELETLGLRWYAVPAVSNNGLEVGGLKFPSCVFNGWYMTNEIACRNFCDEQRYNCLEDLARVLHIDKKAIPFWKDLAMVELNIAVQHSFQRDVVTLTNHHNLSEYFQNHFIKEHKVRGGCPSDWVWIVPPMSGSLSSLFHQEMLHYVLSPRFYYLSDPWKGYTRRCAQEKRKTPLPKLKTVAWAVRFLVRSMSSILSRRPKMTVLYGSESGTAEDFAFKLGDMFKTAFDVQVLNMACYNVSDLREEKNVMLVASTSGNGDPPFNAREFAKGLLELVSSSKGRQRSSVRFEMIEKCTLDEAAVKREKPLSSVRFGVFALGSRAFPKFCGFGRLLDWTMKLLGAQRQMPIGEGDDMCEQAQTFHKWGHRAFEVMCDVCQLRSEVKQEALGHIPVFFQRWVPGRFQLKEQKAPKDMQENLSTVHGENICKTILFEREQLLKTEQMRKTMLLKFSFDAEKEQVSYSPGDHMFILPENPKDLVEAVLGSIEKPFPVDKVFDLQYLNTSKVLLGPAITSSSSMMLFQSEHASFQIKQSTYQMELTCFMTNPASAEKWTVSEHLPVGVSLRQALTSFLDITSPPSQSFLSDMTSFASDDTEAYRIGQLSEDTIEYDTWIDRVRPNLAEVIAEFPSVTLPAVFLLSQLPRIRPRPYSISSSLALHPGEIHLTVSLTLYTTSASRSRTGLCTGWLDNLKLGSIVHCYFRKNAAFHLPIDRSVPIILVASGTGIAPFRSFWQQRQYEMKADGGSGKSGPVVMYFGCRDESEYLHSLEVLQAVKDAALISVYPAYSRQPNTPKHYVQNLLERDASTIADLILNKQACLYVCGHVQLNEGVDEALVKILVQQGQRSTKEAKDMILDMKEYGRYKEDIFGTKRETLRKFRPSLSHMLGEDMA